MASIQNMFVKFMVKRSMNLNKPLEEVRESFERRNKEVRLPGGVEMTSMASGGLAAEVYAVKDAPKDKAAVYLHGGGYALGLYDMTRAFAGKVAKETGLRVFLLNYRVAPEDTYPAALEDSVSLYRWLLENDCPAANIAYITDSSGGSLGFATLMTARDMLLALPACIACFSPAFDFKRTGASHKMKAKIDPYFTQPEYYLEKHYIGNSDPGNPMVSPLYGDLKGLPPMFLCASESDVFLDDSAAMAEKAKAAGVEATVKVWPGMLHNFQLIDALPEAKSAMKEVCAFVKGKLKV